MKAIEFEGQNMMLMPPVGSARGECGQLPVYRDREASTMSSVWKPSKEDLIALAGGAHVVLHIWSGEIHPPVSLSVQKLVELP